MTHGSSSTPLTKQKSPVLSLSGSSERSPKVFTAQRNDVTSSCPVA